MKIKFPLVLLLGAVLLTACKSDETEPAGNDDPQVSYDVLCPTIVNRYDGQDAQLWAVTNQYVNAMVYPTYQRLAESAERLCAKAWDVKMGQRAGTLGDEDIREACECFMEARYYWERSEAFLYGAASDFNIDPHIDSWPLDQQQMGQFFASSAMMAGLMGEDPIGFVRLHNAEFDTALGFHGIEYILFRQGAPRPASALDEREVAFLAAVAGDLRDHCYQLEVSWMGLVAPAAHQQRVAELGMKTRAMGGEGYFYGADLLLSGYSNVDARYHATTYASMPAVVANILVGGCSNICAEVADQKMGQAWRVLTQGGTEDDSADYIESPYSKRSFVDYQGNIYSIQGTLYGGLDASAPHSQSIMAFLTQHGYEGVASLDGALKEAVAALQRCIDSGVAFVDDPGNARVKVAMDAVSNLDNELNKAAQWIEKL